MLLKTLRSKEGSGETLARMEDVMNVSQSDFPEPKNVLCILEKVLKEVGGYSRYRTGSSGLISFQLCSSS